MRFTGTQSPLTVTPVQPNRSADGTIEIRSPNRVPITINSDPQVTGSATQTAAPTNAPNMAEAATQTRLIPLPPDRAAGPASGVQPANPIPQQREPLRQSLNEVNNLPINARAPEPVSTGIVRGTVVNQRAAAPGSAPQSQDLFQPVPQAMPQSIAQPATQQTTVSNIPPTINAPVPAVPPAASSTSNATSEGWRIQLASVGSQEAAIQEWRRFQSANEDLLGSLDLKVQRADLGARGIYYRVQAGILSRDAAST